MNEQRIEQLRAEAAKLSADYRQAEATVHAIGARLAEIDATIRALGSADTAAFVLASIEDRQRQAHAEAERVRAENAANAAWQQLQANGETDEARRERERFQQNRIDAENAREAREEANRQQRIAELRARGVTVYQ